MKNKTYKKKITLILAFALTTSFIGVIQSKEYEQYTQPWLTVFIHGIISIAPLLSFETMGQIKNNQIEDTVYEAYVTNVRNNDFFNRNQAKQKLGLQKIDPMRTDANDGSPIIAKLFDLQHSWLNPSYTTITNTSITNNIIPHQNYYYTFGWSGFMNTDKMYQDSKRFYTELSQEIKQLNAKGIYPKTRLIGFSHGGSICLKLAEVVQKENLERSFVIDELLLLGMPVMRDRDFLITDSLFKNIYHFYSNSDRVQVLDFSQKGKFFSQRRFRARKEFELPDNLLQIKLELFRDTSFKSGWGTEEEISQAHAHRKKHVNRHSNKIRKSSPGHCEWWFFEWTSKYYRDDFALAPMPVAAIMPTIMSKLNKAEFTPTNTKRFGKHITMQIRPFEETNRAFTIKNQQNKKELPFLSKTQCNLLGQTTRKFPFTKITKEMCSTYVNKELAKARAQIEFYEKQLPTEEKMRSHRRIKS